MVIGILVMLALALAFVVFFNRSQKRILSEQMRNQKLAFAHQEELLHSTILTQEEERKRIAKELHDDIGSKLNVIFLNMHRLEKHTNGNEEIEEISKEVNGLINRTIDTTRRISHDLLPPTLEDFGLIEALKELVDGYNQSGKLAIRFNVFGEASDLDNKLIDLNLFRIIQELIKNSVTHGKSTGIDLNIKIDSSIVSIEYQDNGIGFDVDQINNQRGIGIKNIVSRMNMIKAQYNFESSEGNGFEMMINLNYDQSISKT